MKHGISFFFIAIPIILMCCQKQVDAPHVPFQQEEVAGTPLPGQSTYCRIETVWENPFTGADRFLLVLYDEYENPVAITTPLAVFLTPFRTFKYDSWHRLREFRGEYATGEFEFIHFYGYDLNGRIGVDTHYIWANFNNGVFNYLERYISTIEYDPLGRISKTVTDGQNNSLHFETVYNYDAAGNLIHPPSTGIVYDDKVNVNRTNDIWQFLTRDYSMNNPFIADAYSPAGFPTVINTQPPILWSSEFRRGIRLQFSYSCR